MVEWRDGADVIGELRVVFTLKEFTEFDEERSDTGLMDREKRTVSGLCGFDGERGWSGVEVER